MKILDVDEYKSEKEILNHKNEHEKEGIKIKHLDNSFREMILKSTPNVFSKEKDYLNLQRKSKYLLPKSELQAEIDKLSLLYLFIKEVQESKNCVDQIKILTAGIVLLKSLRIYFLNY